jgi:hypothetical protein
VDPTCQCKKREKATSLEGTNQKGKCIRCGRHLHTGQTGRLGEAAAWEEGWAGVGKAEPVGPDPMEDSNEKLIFKFQMNLEFGKTLRNFTRRFRRNLDIRIFPKFFYSSQEFLQGDLEASIVPYNVATVPL